jgi:hypothetical protein
MKINEHIGGECAGSRLMELEKHFSFRVDVAWWVLEWVSAVHLLLMD